MNTKQLRQKLISLAIQGRLVPQDPSDEPASSLLKRIDPKAQPVTKDVPFVAPEGWVWARLGDVAFVTKLAGFEYTKYIAGNIRNEGIPLFKGQNVQEGKIIYEFEAYIPEKLSDELWRSQVRKKCLLTPYVGTIGNIGLHEKTGKYHLGSNVGKIELLNPEHETYIYEEYVLLYLRSLTGYAELTKSLKAAAQPSISIKAIREVFIPLPPLAEQARIVERLESLFSLINTIEHGKEDTSATIKDTKKKLLSLAMQGRLVPQDPSEEPASSLLHRIDPKTQPITKDVPFDVPESWCWCRLKDVFLVNPRNGAEDDMEAGFVPMANISDGYSGDFDVETRKWRDIKNGFTHFADGDVAVAKISPCLENRKSMIVRQLPNGIGAGTTELLVFRPLCVEPRYALYFFKSNYFIDKCINSFNGVAGQKRVGRTFAEGISFPLPPLAEQSRIVERLESIFATLDNIQANLSGTI